METKAMDGTIRLVNGRYFNVVDPEHPSNPPLPLTVLARGLANTCRFAGQIETYFSVAEHSVNASLMVPPEHAVAALLHDAAEALIHDITKPLKMALEDYQRIERLLERRIALQYGIPLEMAAEVKAVDRALLYIEKASLCEGDEAEWFEADAPTPEMIKQAGGAVIIKCLEPQRAYSHFMTRATELGIQPLGLAA